MNKAGSVPSSSATTIPIEPLNLECRICKAVFRASNTSEVMTHIVDQHLSAMVGANAAWTLFAASWLFRAPEDPERWERNQAAFSIEATKALTAMIEQQFTTIDQFIAGACGDLAALDSHSPARFGPHPVPNDRDHSPGGKPMRHRSRAGDGINRRQPRRP